MALGGADHEDRQVGIQVRVLEHLHPRFGVEGDAPMHLDLLLAAEVLKIGNGEEAGVGGVVPFVAQHARGFRRPPCFGQHRPQPVIAKVRDAHDAGPANAHHLRQDAFHVLHRLQGLGQHDTVKLPVGKRPEALVQVGLDHIQPATDGGEDLLLVQLDSDQAAVVGLPQPGQQRARAAAEVEHTGTRRDQFGDALVVEPVLVKDAGGTMRFVFDGGAGVGRWGELVEEGPHHLAIDRQVVGQQEGVVAATALDVAVADRRVVGDQRVDDVARLVGWEQPVAGKADHQPAGAGVAQRPRPALRGVWPRSNRSMATESVR